MRESVGNDNNFEPSLSLISGSIGQRSLARCCALMWRIMMMVHRTVFLQTTLFCGRRKLDLVNSLQYFCYMFKIIWAFNNKRHNSKHWIELIQYTTYMACMFLQNSSVWFFPCFFVGRDLCLWSSQHVALLDWPGRSTDRPRQRQDVLWRCWPEQIWRGGHHC